MSQPHPRAELQNWGPWHALSGPFGIQVLRRALGLTGSMVLKGLPFPSIPTAPKPVPRVGEADSWKGSQGGESGEERVRWTAERGLQGLLVPRMQLQGGAWKNDTNLKV